MNSATKCRCMHRVVSLDKKVYSTLSLSTKVYKWIPLNRQVNLTKKGGGETLQWTSNLLGGGG